MPGRGTQGASGSAKCRPHVHRPRENGPRAA
jgi:hypothetical protein